MANGKQSFRIKTQTLGGGGCVLPKFKPRFNGGSKVIAFRRNLSSGLKTMNAEKTIQRSGFDAIQQEIFSGRIKTFVVWKLDRRSHRLIDGINVLADWCVTH